MDSRIEGTMAEALLDVGVSVPFKDIRIPFRQKPFKLRFTMKRPVLGNQIRITRLFLSMGITYNEMKNFTKEQQMSFLAEHGEKISRIVSLTVCRGKWSGMLFSRMVAWLIRWYVEDIYIWGAFYQFSTLLRIDHFEDIIRLLEQMNPMKPMIESHKTKRG